MIPGIVASGGRFDGNLTLSTEFYAGSFTLSGIAWSNSGGVFATSSGYIETFNDAGPIGLLSTIASGFGLTTASTGATTGTAVRSSNLITFSLVSGSTTQSVSPPNSISRAHYAFGGGTNRLYGIQGNIVRRYSLTAGDLTTLSASLESHDFSDYGTVIDVGWADSGTRMLVMVIEGTAMYILEFSVSTAYSCTPSALLYTNHIATTGGTWGGLYVYNNSTIYVARGTESYISKYTRTS